MTDRLTKQDWIRHGLRTLAADGANAIKIAPMATKLKVSRGSFYWHFRDVADFRSQILQSWQEHSTAQVIQQIDAEAEPDRLKQLLERAFGGERRKGSDQDGSWSVERAIRSWAEEDAGVSELVASVDASRVSYIVKLLTLSGLDARSALPRATFLYWAYLGQYFVLDQTQRFISKRSLSDIADLFFSNRS